MSNVIKPPKPYPDFPLTAHPNGQWCKKVRGRLHYFGPWSDPNGALILFLDQRDDLFAGRTPRPSADGVTLAVALDQFLSAKKMSEQAGDISPRTYADYERVCDRIVDVLKPATVVSMIVTADLENLRSKLTKGRRGKALGPTTLKNDLTRARSFFLYMNENILEKPLAYTKPLRSPSRLVFRKLANERGPRMFERDEINAMLKAATPQLKAMIYLGINCGFGNVDCAMLPQAQIDLVGGWHTFWRPKTHNPRRCPLWPETVKSIKAALKVRPKPVDASADKLVFLTCKGGCWYNRGRGENAISAEFRKLQKKLDTYRHNITTFYSLRRTFETIGATTGLQTAVDSIMGHIAPASDMASIYRQKTYDSQLLAVTNHVRGWLIGTLNIE